MPMKGSSGERDGEGGCAFRQRLSQNGECPASLFRRLAAQAAPWGPRSPSARSPSALRSPPLSQPWGQPRLLPRRGWEKMAQTFLRRGTKVPTAACGRKCPASGEGGAEDTVWREAGPRASPARPTASGLCGTPAPSPQAPRPPAQGPEVRGRPPLVVCLEGKEERRGEKPKVGLAEGLTGNSTTLA